MKLLTVGGADTELGRTKCRCCKRRVIPGQTVFTERFDAAMVGRRLLVWHPSCLAELAGGVPEGTVYGTAAERKVADRIRQIAEDLGIRAA